MKRSATALVCAGAISAVAFAGCGGGSDSGAADTALAKFAPADTPLYVQGVVRPDGDLKSSVQSILDRFPNGDTAGERLIKSFDESLKEDGGDATYADDIEPWLGEQAAFFATSFTTGPVTADDDSATDLKDGAVIGEVTDEDKAREAIKKLADAPVTDSDYNGVTISTSPSKDTPGEVDAVAVFDGVAVAGTEQGVKDAIDASKGDNFSSNSDYSGFVDEKGDDVMLSAFVDPQALLDAIPASPGFGAEERSSIEKTYGDALKEPALASVEVQDDQATIDFSAANTPYTPTGGTDLLDSGFKDAWAAIGIPDIGKSFANFSGQASNLGLSPDEVAQFNSEFEKQAGFSFSDLGKLGDAAFFAAGTSIDELQIGGIFEVSDAAARQQLLSALQKNVAKSGATVKPTTLEGADQAFFISVPDLPIPINVGVSGDKIVVGGGGATEALLSPDGGLTDSESFKQAEDALGGGTDIAFLVDIPPIVDLVDSTGQSDADFEAARPYLDAFDFFAIGTEQDGDRSTSRTVVRFSD